MKIVGIREAQQQLSSLVGKSQRQRVVLTHHGRPVAVLSGVRGRNMEDVILAANEEFWGLIDRRRSAGAVLISHEDLKAALKPRRKRKR